MRVVRTAWMMVLLSTLCWPFLPLAAKEKLPKAAITVSAKQQMSVHTDALRDLMLALYTQHPHMLGKSTQVGPREMTEWVFDGKTSWRIDAIRQLQGQEALALLFDEHYQGDLVLPLIVGLETLLFKAYGAENEYQVPAESNPEQLKQVRCELMALIQKLRTQNKASDAFFASHALIKETLEQLIGRLRKDNQLVPSCEV